MTTLSLSRHADHGGRKFTVSLQDWLYGKWGLLFSHAEDFALADLESDRWLAVLANAFAQRDIRAIGLESAQPQYGSNWIAQIYGYETAVFLDGALPSYSDGAEFNAIVLTSAISRAPARFVMLVDTDLRLRRTFTYNKGDRVPSVLDFVAIIDTLTQTTPARLESTALDWPRHPFKEQASRVAAHV
jgi:alkyl hydroperoxide reductase subunit AhpC